MILSEINNKIIKLEGLKSFIIKNQIKSNDSFEEIIFKKYLEFENVTRVANYINDLGYRIITNGNGRRKYIGNDISAILKDRKAPVTADLKEFVYKLYIKHKKGRRY